MLEEHLLGAYLDTLYDPHRKTDPNGHAQQIWNPDRARHWLGYLATHLRQRNTHDLTWWYLPTTLHRHTRVLLTTTTTGLALALTVVLALGLTGGLAQELAKGLAFALTIGLTLGLINETRFSRGRAGREPERLRLRLRRQRSGQRSSAAYLKKSASEFTSGLAFGLAVGLANVFADGLTIEFGYALPDVFADDLAVGLAFGLAFGLVNVVVSALGDSHDPHATKPWTLLTRDRTVTLVRTIAAGLASGLASMITSGLANMLVYGTTFGFGSGGIGLTAGLLYGSNGGLARLTLSAWGNWLLFARLWLPLTGRLPWRPKRFLEDAYQRGILRKVGAVYQFRHARVRDHLARHYRTKPTSTPHAVGTHEPTTTHRPR